MPLTEEMAYRATGYFSPVTVGQTTARLIRLLDPNVLAVSSQQADANTSDYPIPAHD